MNLQSTFLCLHFEERLHRKVNPNIRKDRQFSHFISIVYLIKGVKIFASRQLRLTYLELNPWCLVISLFDYGLVGWKFNGTKILHEFHLNLSIKTQIKFFVSPLSFLLKKMQQSYIWATHCLTTIIIIICQISHLLWLEYSSWNST